LTEWIGKRKGEILRTAYFIRAEEMEEIGRED